MGQRTWHSPVNSMTRKKLGRANSRPMIVIICHNTFRFGPMQFLQKHYARESELSLEGAEEDK
jgi:hypothetical protein